MAPGALLNMNILEGWTADTFSENQCTWILQCSIIDHQRIGSDLRWDSKCDACRGKALNSNRQRPSSRQRQSTSDIPTRIAFHGTTRSREEPLHLGQFGEMEFNSATTLNGGTFNTFANNYNDGTIAFNGLTTWNGSVTIMGRSQGNRENAIVND